MNATDWERDRKPHLLRLRADPRYRINRWNRGCTIGWEGPCPNWRYLAQFEERPDRPPVPIGTAQLTAKAAAQLCVQHRAGNAS